MSDITAGGIIAAIVVAFIIGFRIIWLKTREPIYIDQRAYKEWLVKAFGYSISDIAVELYTSMRDQNNQNAYALVAEFTKDKFFTSKTYITTARGLIKQIKYIRKYGYIG